MQALLIKWLDNPVIQAQQQMLVSVNTKKQSSFFDSSLEKSIKDIDEEEDDYS